MPTRVAVKCSGTPCALTLGDEPLAGGVEDGAVDVRLKTAEEYADRLPHDQS